MSWTRRSVQIARQESGQRLLTFRYTRRTEDGGVEERVIQWTRKGEPGITGEDYEEAARRLDKKKGAKDDA